MSVCKKIVFIDKKNECKQLKLTKLDLPQHHSDSKGRKIDNIRKIHFQNTSVKM